MAEATYSGYRTFQIEDEVVENLKYDGKIKAWDKRHALYPNLYLELRGEDKNTALARVDKTGQWIELLESRQASGVQAKNREQVFALDALLNDNIPVVVLTGSAGTGKTYLTLAAALERMNQKRYKKVILTRPMSQVGKYQLGALPGPQPLYSKIATPTGWTTMGELAVDDAVIDRYGQPTKVIGVYDKGSKDIYRIYTTDGTWTDCCLDHLWYTETAEDRKRGRKGSVKTTQEILNTLKKSKTHNRHRSLANHWLPRAAAVQYENNRTLPLCPYTLGALLGDGSFGSTIGLSNTDTQLIQRVNSELGQLGCTLSKYDERAIYYHVISTVGYKKTARPIRITNINTGTVTTYSRIGEAIEQTGFGRNALNRNCFTGNVVNGQRFEFLDCPTRWTNPVKDIIYQLGLEGTKATTKFIPDVYKYSSVNDRIELLRGLMDTDGTVKKSGEASFCTTSIQLAEDVIELVRSLGGRATLCKRDRIGKESRLSDRTIIARHPSYEFTISLPEEMNPFYISRKAERFKTRSIHGVWITRIEKVSTGPVRCIRVDNPEHLYLTDNFIVTHNTAEEKFSPYLVNYVTNIEQLMGSGKRSFDDLLEQGRFEIIPIQLFRGASFNRSLVIVDEAQVIDQHEMLTIGTRIGEGSKIVILGDLQQRDEKIAKDKTGIYKLMNDTIFKESPLVAVVELIKSERSAVSELFAKAFEG